MAEETKPTADSESTPSTAESAEPMAADERAALEAAVQDLRDKYLRAVAEADNVRKRAEREVSEARTYGIAVFARDVIGVADNLARALEVVEPEARAADGPLRALVEGMDLTLRDLQKALEKHGIRKLDPLGEKFDPNFHHAMLEVPDAGAPAGTVVQVMQTGYAIGERILRPALVAVARAPSAPGQDEAQEPPEADTDQSD